MAVEPRIDIEVVYALPREQRLVQLRMASGTTALQALQASGLMERYPEIDLARLKMGVFGKVVAPDTCLMAGDRLEIYRPLSVDPKEARRRRGQLRKNKKA